MKDKVIGLPEINHFYEGMRIHVFNKFHDEIAEGFITEISKSSVSIKNDADGSTIQILRRHIAKVTTSEVTLTIIGVEL